MVGIGWLGMGLLLPVVAAAVTEREGTVVEEAERAAEGVDVGPATVVLATAAIFGGHGPELVAGRGLPVRPTPSRPRGQQQRTLGPVQGAR